MAWSTFSEILLRLKRQHEGLSARLSESEAARLFEEVVGPSLAQHLQVVGVRDGVVRVEVAHPIWRAELHSRKNQLLDRVNQKLSGRFEVVDLDFVDPAQSRAYAAQRAKQRNAEEAKSLSKKTTGTESELSAGSLRSSRQPKLPGPTKPT